MRNAMQSITTINLDHEQMLILDGGLQSRVRVLYGATWLTEEGETGDTVLRAGGEHALGRGRALIEGLGPTQLQITAESGRVTTRLADGLRAALRDARSYIARLQLGPVAPQPHS